MARVLVVDDNPEVRELLAEFLRSRNHEVETAPDGPSALAAVRRGLPQAILLDLMMPGMTGMGYSPSSAPRGRTFP